MSNQVTRLILIVDDDSEFRRSLLKTLLKAGYTVRTASSGTRASELISKEAYALILLDIHMPGKSGLETLKDIKEKSPESKVIIISANGDLDVFSKAQEGGAFAFLQKPIKRETLLNCAALALNNSHV